MSVQRVSRFCLSHRTDISALLYPHPTTSCRFDTHAHCHGVSRLRTESTAQSKASLCPILVFYRDKLSTPVPHTIILTISASQVSDSGKTELYTPTELRPSEFLTTIFPD